ncbi:SAM-dependent methyltransferase [Dysgonomonas sp. PFB1-18]|uniref:class I SAM-dependent methyltransferase n=1 Tax=unclassified Dysgonomonas TaxID=2630389 RepID=UPI002473AA30|nr:MULTISPECIES: class I SAM-dependent methyltransferase [unclassified Dysgonomonas]MDH6311122.1 SAM-dependent methyltransferase [Dysgonomonas sp. PF1-14]MDH6340960.1 SAM-dependent methyltransferase [Dysgonomonas sp. PF1-16]MDH6382619.1 SAM-dependent methyltransferase [Dysgonomonas sp. PFB1-18]MDH6399966.1 SAM-dependent methyltransferase [Dysgonomonas sp. PF1-23]
MNNKWDEQYNIEEYRYGEIPNLFFKEIIDTLPAGKILLPADGEGRNSVYAAKRGWVVDAFDLSSQGKEKALRLAQKNNVDISFKVIDFENIVENYIVDSYNAIVLTYVHLPEQLKEKYHRSLLSLLKNGGYIIIEGFSKDHVKYQRQNPLVGGPPDVNMMYSKQEILSTFDSLGILLLEEKETELAEGTGHNGKASVIRFVGKKI